APKNPGVLARTPQTHRADAQDAAPGHPPRGLDVYICPRRVQLGPDSNPHDPERVTDRAPFPRVSDGLAAARNPRRGTALVRPSTRSVGRGRTAWRTKVLSSSDFSAG